MEQPAGVQIGKRAFFQSLIILFVLMLGAGVLTLTVPAGQYDRTLVEGREVIEPDSFRQTERPDYPAWRWLTAPVEVLWGPDSLTIITILVFLLMVGSAFAVMDRSGILKAAIGRIVRAFGGRKYLLLLVVSLFFMLLGAFFGIFEEVVPLVPLMIALAYMLGWDSLVGLGMAAMTVLMGGRGRSATDESCGSATGSMSSCVRRRPRHAPPPTVSSAGWTTRRAAGSGKPSSSVTATKPSCPPTTARSRCGSWPTSPGTTASSPPSRRERTCTPSSGRRCSGCRPRTSPRPCGARSRP